MCLLIMQSLISALPLSCYSGHFRTALRSTGLEEFGTDQFLETAVVKKLPASSIEPKAKHPCPSPSTHISTRKCRALLSETGTYKAICAIIVTNMYAVSMEEAG